MRYNHSHIETRLIKSWLEMRKNPLKTTQARHYTSYNVYFAGYVKAPFNPGVLNSHSYASQAIVGLGAIVQPLTAALAPLFRRCILRLQSVRTKSHKPAHSPAPRQFLARSMRPGQSNISDVLKSANARFLNILPVDNQTLSPFRALRDLKNLHLITWQPAFYLLGVKSRNVLLTFKFTRFFRAFNCDAYSHIESVSQLTRPAVSIQPASQCGRVAFPILAAGVGLVI